MDFYVGISTIGSFARGEFLGAGHSLVPRPASFLQLTTTTRRNNKYVLPPLLTPSPVKNELTICTDVFRGTVTALTCKGGGG